MKMMRGIGIAYCFTTWMDVGRTRRRKKKYSSSMRAFLISVYMKTGISDTSQRDSYKSAYIQECRKG